MQFFALQGDFPFLYNLVSFKQFQQVKLMEYPSGCTKISLLSYSNSFVHRCKELSLIQPSSYVALRSIPSKKSLSLFTYSPEGGFLLVENSIFDLWDSSLNQIRLVSSRDNYKI
jgi:hypothetical protein